MRTPWLRVAPDDATGQDPRAQGWARLLDDVVGTGAARPSSRLFELLSGPTGADEPWSRQQLDELWSDVHGDDSVEPHGVTPCCPEGPIARARVLSYHRGTRPTKVGGTDVRRTKR
jgi:hypothetical protein